jgi:serine/threonine protein kinase
LGKVLG